MERGTGRGVVATLLAQAVTVAMLAALLPAIPRATASEPAVQLLDPACADAPAERFLDVAGGHRAAVDCLGWWGIAEGVGAGRYAPSRTVTRAQMATFVARTLVAAGAALPTAAPDAFADDDGTVHEPATNQLAALGVVEGVRGGAFDPQRAVTRGQMAAFLARAWRVRTGTPLAPGVTGFGDLGDGVHRADVERVTAAGLAAGVTGTAFQPSAPVTRAQMATFLARLLAALVEQGHAATPPPAPVPLPPPQPVFASAGGIALHLPSSAVEMIGYHQATHPGAQQLSPASTGPSHVTLPSRGRGTGSRTAADVVAAPTEPVLAPVSGRVLRAGSYALYCRHPDHFVAIEPVARPGWEVKVLHFEGLRVRAGDSVTASRTVIGSRPRALPLRSQVDRYSHARDWPHLHVEIVDPSVPTRPGGC